MPQFAALGLSIVEPWGTDNAVWRLGPDLVVRFPRMEWAVGQIELEATWLPQLAPALSVVVPEPVAVGKPGSGYPYPWAVHRWVPGQGAAPDLIADPVGFALGLAQVTRELRTFPVDAAPAATNRSRPIAVYDEPTRTAIDSAAHLIDADAALAIWEAALAAAPNEQPVWVHGDLEGNCLLRDGTLHGLVDWGSACVGDPAVDVQVVWSPLFTAESRTAFLDNLAVDDATLARSRGAAINQACAALPYYLHTYPLIVERSVHKLQALGVAVNTQDVAAATERSQ
jgi:aminoglycoside phosphotransferase (APT) family kinase protein